MVSDFMRRVRRRGTAPETTLRSALHRLGVRFGRGDGGLPGRPDILLVRVRVAVFVDGCFWHGCAEHFVAPKANAAFWSAKIGRNRERDAEIDARLQALGWRVVHVWEHEEPAAAAHRIAALWREG
jgi:DNA mismatch endonuclease (patch repair protein)